MFDILVVGLSGRGPSDDWSTLLAGRIVVARNGHAASKALSPETAIAATYDAVFELADLRQTAELIADAIVEAAGAASIAYLTPGFATLGDAVVDRLCSTSAHLSFAPGRPPVNVAISGPITIVDALEVAAAEISEPFIGALPALDSSNALLVTNWHGATVTSLAARRIERVFPAVHERVADDGGFLFVPAMEALATHGSLAALEHIVARLRRDDGCPWDREQTTLSLLPALAEEAEELRQAIEAHDIQNVIEEMGDVLVNVLMQAQISSEAGDYRFSDAIASATRKLVRRHPHVFGGQRAANADEVLAIWKQVKANEKSGRLDIATTA